MGEVTVWSPLACIKNPQIGKFNFIPGGASLTSVIIIIITTSVTRVKTEHSVLKSPIFRNFWDSPPKK